MSSSSLLWEDNVYELLRERNKKYSEPFVGVYKAYESEEKQHRHLVEKHVEIRNQISVIQYHLQSYQKENDIQHSELIDEVKLLLTNLQQDLSPNTTKDFDDVKIRIDLERTIKSQKQLIGDTAAEIDVLKSELSSRTEALANVTDELDHKNAVVETIQKELESSRNLLAATEDRLKEVENNNGLILSKLMDEKQKRAEIENELSVLKQAKNSKAANIIEGGFSFVRKSIFGNGDDDEDLREKEEEEFVEVDKTNDVVDDNYQSTLVSEVTIPRSTVKIVKCHGSEINDVSFGCKHTVITGGADSQMKVFDIDRCTGHLGCDMGEAVQESMHDLNCGSPVISVHSIGENAAGACADGIARIWNVRTGRLRQSLSGHANKVTSVRLIGGEKAVSGAADRIVRFWDLSSRQANLVCNLKTNSYVGAVDASPDCNTVCSGHQDGGLRFWNMTTKDRIHFIPKVHTAIVTCVQFDPKLGRYLLSASRDNTISVIDTRTYETTVVLRAPEYRLACDWSQVSFSPDSSMIAAGSSDGRVFVWDTLYGELQHCAPSTLKDAIVSICWKDNGFAACHKNGNVTMWS